MSGSLAAPVVELEDAEQQALPGLEPPADAGRKRVPECEVAPQAPTAAHSRPVSPAVAELGAFPVRLLAGETGLPLATTALCRAEGVPAPVVLTSSKAAYTAARARRWPIFLGSELGALALAAEHERLTIVQTVEWCARKAEDPGWRLSPAVALGLGVAGRGLEAKGWTFAPVLAAAGLELLEVVVGDQAGVELVERAGEGT